MNSGVPLGWAIPIAINRMLLLDIWQLVPSPAVSLVFLIIARGFLVSVSPRICFLGAAWFSRYPRRMVERGLAWSSR
jgi:hypothetical protein